MEIKEILVISGKGGTGKTTITSSIIPYFDSLVIGDYDVDAPNLKILLNPSEKEKNGFLGMKKAKIDSEKCIHCNRCYEYCKFEAMDNVQKCEGYGVCEYICPVGAIEMIENRVGDIMVGETEYGTMVHACLEPGEENSGKLVAEVRRKAKKIAQLDGKEYIILDGAPGVACNVISSLTGVKRVIIVTEPTLSGLHDLERVVNLVERFRVKPCFVINKFDISIEMTDKIETYLNNLGYKISMKIPFDKKIFKAIMENKIPSIAEKKFFEDLGIRELIEELK
ncbi:ATP-binding protein [Fusobacterium mortiferum]|uniref:ATP-binding protein n=1 Tax=Fusobacterium mortiferum TaxID=850 RepID=UPI000E508118|nr:ATP-binding protein [Fusobacterium mortiferum]RHF66236.1 (4Fe-4S)-binding protein [Fusobacterium mortiferum]